MKTFGSRNLENQTHGVKLIVQEKLTNWEKNLLRGFSNDGEENKLSRQLAAQQCSSILLNTVAARETVIENRDSDQDRCPDHAEGGKLADLGIFPKFEDRHGNYRRLRADE